MKLNSIVSTKSLRDIFQHIIHTKKNIIIFDLDNTLIRTPGQVGSDQWFNYMLKVCEEQEGCSKKALIKTRELCVLVHQAIDVQLIEESTCEIFTTIHELPDCATMALTARSEQFIERTLQQLTHLEVHFQPSAPSTENQDLIVTEEGFYRDGILFCGGNNKGELLIEFFKKINYWPEHVIFIDDKEKNLHDVHNALEIHNISCVSMHYTALEEMVNNFNPEEAAAELEKILTTTVVS